MRSQDTSGWSLQGESLRCTWKLDGSFHVALQNHAMEVDEVEPGPEVHQGRVP